MIAESPRASRPQTRFVVPDGLDAVLPPEHRGIARDGVRLLVVTPNGVSHHHFRALPQLLDPGDLVVVNTSATLPAALTGHHSDGRPALVHVSGWTDESEWIVEIRRHDNGGPDVSVASKDVIRLPGHLMLTLTRPHPDHTVTRSRLWTALVTPPTALVEYLAQHGRPIVYGHVPAGLPLSERQTVYADEPGSAEMPSAGRPFSSDVVLDLVTRGVALAPILLHTGVSSQESGEPPQPERFRVSQSTANLVNATRAGGGRVVAVGTTVTRALESAVADDGTARAGSGWTSLVLGPDRPPRLVTGLLTGWHDPAASHLALVESVAGSGLTQLAYDAAIEERYLWHEFGDSCLLLP